MGAVMISRLAPKVNWSSKKPASWLGLLKRKRPSTSSFRIPTLKNYHTSTLLIKHFLDTPNLRMHKHYTNFPLLSVFICLAVSCSASAPLPSDTHVATLDNSSSAAAADATPTRRAANAIATTLIVVAVLVFALFVFFRLKAWISQERDEGQEVQMRMRNPPPALRSRPTAGIVLISQGNLERYIQQAPQRPSNAILQINNQPATDTRGA